MSHRNPIAQRGRVLRIEVTPERWGLITLAARMRGQKVQDFLDAAIDEKLIEAREQIRRKASWTIRDDAGVFTVLRDGQTYATFFTRERAEEAIRIFQKKFSKTDRLITGLSGTVTLLQTG